MYEDSRFLTSLQTLVTVFLIVAQMSLNLAEVKYFSVFTSYSLPSNLPVKQQLQEKNYVFSGFLEDTSTQMSLVMCCTSYRIVLCADMDAWYSQAIEI